MKGEFSMQSVRTLFRLDLKSRYGTTNTDKNAWKQTLGHIGNAVFFLLVYAVLIVGRKCPAAQHDMGLMGVLGHRPTERLVGRQRRIGYRFVGHARRGKRKM